MPVIASENIQNDAVIVVWKIEESEDLLRDHYPYTQDFPELEHISHPRVRCESLAARICVMEAMKRMDLPFKGIHKDEHGKPHLKESVAEISYAHSYPVAAAIVCVTRPTGIDFEVPRKKLIALREKFLSATELNYMGEDMEKLCLSWAAKETLYKIYGRKEVLFKQHFFIKPFELNEKGILEAHVRKTHFDRRYILAYRTMEKGYLCFCLP